PHHKSLQDYLSKEDFEKLKEIFHDRLGVSHLKFNLVYKNFKPIMLSTTMTRLAFDDVKFYELELIEKAKANDMLTLGLETVEREVKALEKFPVKEQIEALEYSIANFDKQLKDYQVLIEAYKRGDLHKTLAYFMHPVEHNEDFRKIFIVNRNEEWVPKMIQYMHQAPTFFAIGTSHLADEEGLIHLLVEEGYTLRPIKDTHMTD
ncbi:MAG: TraB/GumN family protein, partial [Fulvivirga sp.]|nr:TraB/GumN family protein [Fulvivirga sp.]